MGEHRRDSREMHRDAAASVSHSLRLQLHLPSRGDRYALPEIPLNL